MELDKIYNKVCEQVAVILNSSTRELSLTEIIKLIRKSASENNLRLIPKNEHIIPFLDKNSQYRKKLRVRPTKTSSGVAVITVMPKPYNCPHGICVYCPGGIKYNTPLSYVGTESVTKLAQSFDFNPLKQIQSKLLHLKNRGHDITKIELVIVGGTFPFYSIEYQRDFVKSCFDSLNGKSSDTLEESLKMNEKANHRCVGFTVETKPDYCKQKNIDMMLEFGVTRVEIGVQTLQDDVYKIVNRGHTLMDVIEAFKIARDSGYKIVAHMMPGLPGSSPERDINDFKKLLYDSQFKPDMLKIYPTLVLKNTGLYKLYSEKKYNPYSEEDLTNILIEVKKIVPNWIRIMRVQREIEDKDIVAGPKNGNLRQIIHGKMKELEITCKCIRCREAGLQSRSINEDDIIMNRTDYDASNGKEIFLSMESNDELSILGFLRMRNTISPGRKELVDSDRDIRNSVVIRELHVYGKVLDIGGRKNEESFQHRGLGKKLMQEAERIAKDELHVKKISVISAIGTREYYKKMGYFINGPYVSKTL